MSDSYNCLGFQLFECEKAANTTIRWKSRLATIWVTGCLFEWFEEGRMQGKLEITFCPIQTMAPVAGSQVTHSDAPERTTPQKKNRSVGAFAPAPGGPRWPPVAQWFPDGSPGAPR